ncbi:MAG: branched-chain amino acid aminotransferase [Candidatus Lambdaproteobacteria bacterium]|nr:branched-chain amino acid aminotransferase [Candidatus Lambdaproteobacteria bacterium]
MAKTTLKIEPVPAAERKPKPQDETSLGFGRIYSDHMFSAEWSEPKGWHNARVSKYGPIAMAPAALVLHYGQTVFEGLKAYRAAGGDINLFRPDKNIERLNNSARRLDMPPLEPELVSAAFEALLELDHEWVPRSQGASLYIRPTMIATEPYIGLKSSSTFLFFIITGPVGAYYPEGFNPVRIRVEERYSRAGPGGLGSVKTAANYAASLLAEKEAKKKGFTQVLWLDAAHRKYVEEVGSMNILFKIGERVITPPLGGTILPGVTRDSVIQLLKSWDVPVEERQLSIAEVIEAHAAGTLEEVFGCGTAAVIAPVGMLDYQGQGYQVREGKTGPLAQRLFDELIGIQYGRLPDRFRWLVRLQPGQKNASTPTVRTLAV